MELLLAIINLLLIVLMAFIVVRGERRIIPLSADSPPAPDQTMPSVAIVVAARNEERSIAAGVSSLLRLDYPHCTVTVVDDRSDDQTPQILQKLADGEPRLRIVRIDVLPPGWLGKNHALWRGAQSVDAELILFTDADIVMAPDVLSRAVARLENAGLDHLALTPRMELHGLLLRLLGLAFGLFFGLFARPWRASDPKSSAHIGIGAFNLLRRSAYQAVGGHQSIRLRPDDDLKLGKILKQAGYRQDIAYAPEFLRVEWYATLGEAFRGLEKNAFSGCDYRISVVLAGVLAQLLFFVRPYAALFFADGPAWWLDAATVLVLTALAARGARLHRESLWLAPGFPVGTLLFSTILLRTMILNLWQGGIVWRGTFYPLEELKRNRV